MAARSESYRTMTTRAPFAGWALVTDVLVVLETQSRVPSMRLRTRSIEIRRTNYDY